MHSDEPYVMEAFRNGAMGYVLKDLTGAELLQAVRTVMGGGQYLSPTLSDLAVNAYRKKRDGIANDIYSTLSSRERMVLQLAAEGNNTATIARQHQPAQPSRLISRT